MMGIVDINHMIHLTFGILSMTGFNSMLKFLVNSLATIDCLCLVLLLGVYAWSYMYVYSFKVINCLQYSPSFFHHLQMVPNSVEEEALRTLFPSSHIVHNQQKATIQQVS